jgi:hypothetical protein
MKRIHGETNTKLYKIWQDMKARCYRIKKDRYKNYGLRGIIVCEEWRNNYISFREWAYKNGYKENLQIDRKDNDGNYEPNNCRFISGQRNAQNRGPQLNKTSKYKGVSFYKSSDRWKAQIKINKHVKHIGYFDSQKEAAIAYNSEAKKAFGEFAYLNKIDNE